MAQTCAVIHIVRLKAGADKFLEQISLFIRTLRGSEPCKTRSFGFTDHFLQAVRREIQRFIPGRFAEIFQWIRWIKFRIGILRDAFFSD